MGVFAVCDKNNGRKIWKISSETIHLQTKFSQDIIWNQHVVLK